MQSYQLVKAINARCDKNIKDLDKVMKSSGSYEEKRFQRHDEINSLSSSFSSILHADFETKPEMKKIPL